MMLLLFLLVLLLFIIMLTLMFLSQQFLLLLVLLMLMVMLLILPLRDLERSACASVPMLKAPTAQWHAYLEAAAAKNNAKGICGQYSSLL
jgi:hypothetical protein